MRASENCVAWLGGARQCKAGPGMAWRALVRHGMVPTG